MLNPITFFLEPMFQKGRMAICWFLWALCFLYLLSPLLKKLFDNEEYRKIVTFLLMFLMLVIFGINFYRAIDGMNIIDIYVPQSMRLWSHISYYWLGAVIYRIIRANNKALNCKSETYSNVIRRNDSLFMLLIIAISNGMIQYGTAVIIMGEDSPEYMFECPIVILMNALIFIFGLFLDQNNIGIASISHLIKYSLGVYLIHLFVKAVIIKMGIWDISWFLNWVIMLIGTLSISIILYRIPFVNKLIKL